MRYLIILVGYILLIFNIAKGQQHTVSVTLTSTSLVYNNSVGNEWSTSARVNGNYLFRGDSVHVKLDTDDNIVLKTSATESDKYSDYGSSTKRITINDITANESPLMTETVTVREDRGRYAGNTAQWKFRFKVALEE